MYSDDDQVLVDLLEPELTWQVSTMSPTQAPFVDLPEGLEASPYIDLLIDLCKHFFCIPPCSNLIATFLFTHPELINSF